MLRNATYKYSSTSPVSYTIIIYQPKHALLVKCIFKTTKLEKYTLMRPADADPNS